MPLDAPDASQMKRLGFMAGQLVVPDDFDRMGTLDQVDARRLRRGLLDNGYEELPMSSEHAVMIDSLPPIHKDPFDRLLVAQSTVEGITLLTTDALVARYPGPVQRV